VLAVRGQIAPRAAIPYFARLNRLIAREET
jgi:hypothetical protein